MDIGEMMSDYTRQPLLSEDEEAELKSKLEPLWLQDNPKLTGGQIARELGFGEPGVYEKLKPGYVYFYRQKFDLPIRNKPPFAQDESRYKHPPEELGIMMPDEFVEKLNEMLPLPAQHHYTRCARAYLIIHYWSPLRESEVFERVRKDFEITDTEIIIHLLRKKKRHKPTDKDEPVTIRREWDLVEEAIAWIDEFKADKRPFSFESDTARNYVKLVFENCYPHYFRFNWISDKVDDIPNTTMREIKTKTRLTISALERYIFADKKSEKKIDDRTTERLRIMKKQSA